VEGEKDVHTMELLGVVATCNDGGAGNWRPEHTECLHGATVVVVVADQDDPGREHARCVGEALSAVCATVHIVRPVTCKDVTEMHELGLGLDGLEDAPDSIHFSDDPKGAAGNETNGDSFRFVTPTKDAAGNDTNAGLPFAVISEALQRSGETTEWLHRGYVPRRGLTLLAAKQKVGKSVWVMGLLRVGEHGGTYFGSEVKPFRALLLSEEGPDTMQEKRLKWQLGDHVHLLLRGDARGERWPEIVAQAHAYMKREGIDLLVIDTWQEWSGLGPDGENDAGKTLAALAPLQAVADEGRGVLIVAHHRKMDGDHGDQVRGSGALGGAVGVILELARTRGPNVRVLKATSRYQATPPKRTAVLRGTDYVVTEEGGEESDAPMHDTRPDDVLTALRRVPEPVTTRDLAGITGLSPGATGSVLTRLAAAGRVLRTGRGVKGDPAKWSVASTPTVTDDALFPAEPATTPKETNTEVT
jgi:hypothetical protein